MLAGNITLQATAYREDAAKKKQLEGSLKHLQADYFNFMQLKTLIGRASNDENFAKKYNIPIYDAEIALDALGKVVKIADEIVTNSSRNIFGRATNTGLNYLGIVKSANSIPIDPIQPIESSTELYRKDKPALVKYIEKLADDLEDELWLSLKDKGYTLVKTERYDKENQKHCLLLAVEENSLHKVFENVNVSLEDIHANYMVVADCIGEEIDPLLYQKLLTKWEGERGNKKKNDDEKENEELQDENEEDEKKDVEENEEEEKGGRVGNEDDKEGKEEEKAGNEETEEEKEEDTVGNQGDEEENEDDKEGNKEDEEESKGEGRGEA